MDTRLSPHTKLRELQESSDYLNWLNTSFKDMFSKLPSHTKEIATNGVIDTFKKNPDLNFLYAGIYRLVEALRFVLNSQEKDFLNNNVAIGISPKFEVNAYCCKLKPPYYGYILFLQVGIMQLFYELLKLSLHYYLGKSSKDIFIFQAKKLLNFYLKEKKYVHSNFSLNKEESILLNWLIESLELTILAHEYAHIALKHTETAFKSTIQLFGIDFSYLNWKKRHEKEADLYALDLIFKRNLIPEALKSSRLPCFIAGALCLFKILHIFENLLNLHSETHPPGDKRYTYAYNHLEKAIKIDKKYFLICEQINQTLSLLT